jgi:catechol 2,3-dioxygenase-like lactoylglutathione lyase family enzyme
MILACSHLVVATSDVTRMCRFFSRAFGVAPAFENEMFAEFVLPSAFRIAFFKPVGASSQFFGTPGDRSGCSFGVTVSDVDAVHLTLDGLKDDIGIQLSGPPREHPWGEKSFLMVDPDGNRWEIAQTPSPGGMLTER